jgi:hypothetical protein
MFLPRSTVHPASTLYRVLAAVTLVVQLGVASWPALEQRAPVLRGMHTETQGEWHLGLHDEATCTVCAVRLSHAAAASRVVGTEPRAQLHPADAVTVAIGPWRHGSRSHSTRAPPAPA